MLLPMARVRKPGSSFDLSDEELINAPAKLLTPEQRKRRRSLRQSRAAANRARARKEREASGRAKVIFCQGTKKDGEPCQNYAVTGCKHCVNHLNSAERAKTGIRHPSEIKQENRLRAREINGQTLNAPQTARQVMEVAVEKLLQRYFKAVGLEFQGFDEQGMPVVYDHGAEAGLHLHGESKEGYIEMSNHPDLVSQIQVIEKLWDRVYGRPKQTQVLEGGSKPVQIQPVRSVERAQRVAGLLRSVGAIPHEGRRRIEPSEDSGKGASTLEPDHVPDNVVSLHDSDD